jgi:hypothetical protein
VSPWDWALRQAHIHVRGKAILCANITHTKHAIFTFIMSVAVPFAFSARSTKATVAKISKGNRTFGCAFDSANIYIRGPIVKVSDVTHADQVAFTFVVGITIPCPFFTGPANETVVVVSLAEPAVLRFGVNTWKAYIYLRTKEELATDVVHTKQPFFALVVSVTVPRPFFTGTTQGAIVEATSIHWTTVFRGSLNAYIHVPAKAMADSYVFSTNQTVLALILPITVAFSNFTRPAQHTVVIIAWIHRAWIWRNHTHIYVPPEVEAASQILAADQTRRTFLVAVTIPLFFLTRTAEQAVIRVPLFNRTLSFTRYTDVHK